MKKGKVKYIVKKMLGFFLIAFFSIIVYQLFIDLRKDNDSEEVYGTKISAEEDEVTNNDISTTIEKISNYVVGISKIKNTGSSVFLASSSQSLGLGTGIIISKKGYILTNQHVSGNQGEYCYITDSNGQTYSGKIVFSNSDIDIAIIKVNKTFKECAPILNTNIAKVGEEVYAIGNPIGYEFQRTVTSGIISAVNRTVKIKNEDETYSYMSNLIQTDATINPGNSGGPLIDKSGNIIGINTIKITSAEGIGFAIPIDIVKPIIDKYELNGEFKEAYLGIFAYDGSIMSYINQNLKYYQGVYIENIVPNGPADNSELKQGDIIIKIDNTSINKMSELQKYIFIKEPEEEVNLYIIRDNEEKMIKIKLGKK